MSDLDKEFEKDVKRYQAAIELKFIPLANKEERDQDWIFSVPFLDKISQEISDISSADVDDVLKWLHENNYIKTE